MTNPARALIAIAAATTLAPAGPDLIIGDISGANYYGQLDGVHAYSLGVTSCNLGDQSVNWLDASPDHPVLAQNLYRLTDDGRLRHVGMSHVAHAFATLQTSLCSTCEPGGDVQHLGPGCSNPSSSGISGGQAYLGPRAEVNASTGAVQFPFTGFGELGNTTAKRLQVLDADVETGGTYFAELQHIAEDDASASAGTNNASYRRATMSVSGSLLFSGATVTQAPAIFAWADAVPGVQISTVDIPGDGRLHVGANATQIAPGQWRYDYAVHNLNSHRSIGSIGIPAPGDISSDEFQAPLYHTNEPVINTPWAFGLSGGVATWSIPAHTSETDQTASAVRWGTMYTYSFVSDAPPTTGQIELGLFRPGAPVSVSVSGPVPASVCVADLAEPFGSLDFSDVAAFLGAFGWMLPEADLAEPFGVYDFSDVAAFLTAFGAGCP